VERGVSAPSSMFLEATVRWVHDSGIMLSSAPRHYALTVFMSDPLLASGIHRRAQGVPKHWHEQSLDNSSWHELAG
jgi:hypothetical protein